jgi:peptide deformylase
VSSTRRTLRYYGDPVLRAKAQPVSAFTPELRDLIDGMFECMYREEGIGLAAPQVGEGVRVFVLDVPAEDDDAPRVKRAFVNPVLVEKAGRVTAEEGCLSIPGIRADVKRAARVAVLALDETGLPFRLEAEGLLARAIQHETDHLDGILFVDRLSAIQRKLLEGKLKRFQAPSGDAAAEASGAAPSL